MNTEEVHKLIRSRMSVFPPQFTEKRIDKTVLLEILESANWAPSHRMTEPWRFKVFTGNGLKRLGDFMAESYRKSTPKDEFSLVKYEKMKNNPRKSGAVIAICMQRDPDKRVPEWEEIAAVSCAVQNIWLALRAHEIGGYWSTPNKTMEEIGELVSLNTGEKCLGLFYMGYHKPFPTNRKRNSIEQKVAWLS